MYVPKTLATIIAEKAGVDVDVALNVMETMCLHIIECVKEDKEVSFTNFIKFKRTTRKARTFMPPKATQAVEIGERFAMIAKVMPKISFILNPEDEALITKAGKKPLPKNSKSDSDKSKKSKKAKSSDDEMGEVDEVNEVNSKPVTSVKKVVVVASSPDSDEEKEKESDSDEEESIVVAKQSVVDSDDELEEKEGDSDEEEVIEGKKAKAKAVVKKAKAVAKKAVVKKGVAMDPEDSD